MVHGGFEKPTNFALQGFLAFPKYCFTAPICQAGNRGLAAIEPPLQHFFHKQTGRLGVGSGSAPHPRTIRPASPSAADFSLREWIRLDHDPGPGLDRDLGPSPGPGSQAGAWAWPGAGPGPWAKPRMRVLHGCVSPWPPRMRVLQWRAAGPPASDSLIPGRCGPASQASPPASRNP